MENRAKLQGIGERHFRLLVASIKDYAIFLLDTGGHIASWNVGAQRIYDYPAGEIIGRHFSTFYIPEDLTDDKPSRELEIAVREGKYEEEGVRVRKDGSHFWANVLITPLYEDGTLLGFAKITRDITEHKEAEERLQRSNEELRRMNAEIEAFSYSVSHDLRAPLRAIDGFSYALLEDAGDSLNPAGQAHLHRIRSAAQRMAQLIDAMLTLSRLSRQEMYRQPVDLSHLARHILHEFQALDGRQVEYLIPDGIRAPGDPELLRIALNNLLNNAWKFTAKQAHARIELGMRDDGGETVYFVRDNGAGFDMRYANKLFGVFQRLHGASEFEGTGIGLATVARIIARHGGRIWAQSQPDQGATFFFTLPPAADDGALPEKRRQRLGGKRPA